jgi:hypothetical protein
MKTSDRSRTSLWLKRGERIVKRRDVTFSLLTGVVAAAAFAVASRARVLTASQPASDQAAGAGRLQLVGEWKLNPELSEDPREKMRQARAEGGRPEGGAPGGGGGGWGGHGSGHGHGAPGGQGRGQNRPQGDAEGRWRSMLLTASRITVTNLEPEVTMLDPEGDLRRLHADDKAYKDDTGTEVKARWDASRLVVETKTQAGSIKETWTVDSDPRRLTVLLELRRSSGEGVTFRRVFDPIARDAPPR